MQFDTSSSEDDTDDSDSEWCDDTSYFDTLPAIVDMEPKSLVLDSNQEIDYFLKIFDEDIFTHLVSESNKYAETKQKPLSESFENITTDELKAFLGCQIIMGIHILPQLSNY